MKSTTLVDMISDNDVVLLEQTLHKNQEMMAENQEQREEMTAKDEEHCKVLGGVNRTEEHQTEAGQRS